MIEFLSVVNERSLDSYEGCKPFGHMNPNGAMMDLMCYKSLLTFLKKDIMQAMHKPLLNYSNVSILGYPFVVFYMLKFLAFMFLLRQ